MIAALVTGATTPIPGAITRVEMPGLHLPRLARLHLPWLPRLHLPRLRLTLPLVMMSLRRIQMVQ